MKKLFLTLSLTALTLATASAQLVIAEFGTDTGRFSKANFDQRNYGWSAGTDTATTFQSTGSNFSQILWSLSSPVDLSGLLDEEFTLTGDATTTSGPAAMRIYFYNVAVPGTGNNVNVASYTITTDFSGSIDGFTPNDFVLNSTDGFSNTTTGSFDWSNVQAVSFRYQNNGSVDVDFTSLTIVPEPTSAALLLGAVSLLTLRRRRA